MDRVPGSSLLIESTNSMMYCCVLPPSQETEGDYESIGDTRREIGQTAEEEGREGTQAQGEDGLGQAGPGMLHAVT